MPRQVEATDAYPLKWPAGTPRTYSSQRSAFKSRTWQEGMAEVKEELARMRVTEVVISFNIRLKPGTKEPYAGQNAATLQDTGVAVYFKRKVNGTAQDAAEWTCLPCDKWRTLGENFHAIALTIQRMRDLDRYGVGKSGQSFDGYKALPAAASSESDDWTTVLAIPHGATEVQIREAHIKQVKAIHAEGGDTSSAIARVNVARDAALKERQ